MILLTLALATPPAGGNGSGGGLGFGAFLPMILVFVIFYLLILRPQSKRQKEHQRMLSALAKGDRVVTSGGIHGTVQRVNDKEETLILKISDDVKIEVDRGAIVRKLSGGDE